MLLTLLPAQVLHVVVPPAADRRVVDTEKIEPPEVAVPAYLGDAISASIVAAARGRRWNLQIVAQFDGPGQAC